MAINPDGTDLLNKDTQTVRSAVQRLVNRPLSDSQFGALSSFIFNVGVGNFASSTMLRHLRHGEDDAAARQFSRWVSSRGRVLNGLIARRACEAALFKGLLRHRSNGLFYREDCSGLGAAPSSSTIIDIGRGERR
jgi:lysozyme